MFLKQSWEEYLLNEGVEKDVFVYIQGIHEIIRHLKPKTMTEKRRIALASQHILEVKKYARRMQNKIDLLQEKLNILEEGLTKNEEG
jgi:hypothetical protein